MSCPRRVPSPQHPPVETSELSPVPGCSPQPPRPQGPTAGWGFAASVPQTLLFYFGGVRAGQCPTGRAGQGGQEPFEAAAGGAQPAGTWAPSLRCAARHVPTLLPEAAGSGSQGSAPAGQPPASGTKGGFPPENPSAARAPLPARAMPVSPRFWSLLASGSQFSHRSCCRFAAKSPFPALAGSVCPAKTHQPSPDSRKRGVGRGAGWEALAAPSAAHPSFGSRCPPVAGDAAPVLRVLWQRTPHSGCQTRLPPRGPAAELRLTGEGLAW